MNWTGKEGGTLTNTPGALTGTGHTGTSTLALENLMEDTTVTCSIGAASTELTLDVWGEISSLLYVNLLG